MHREKNLVAVLRWVGRSVGYLLTALVLVGAGFYLNFLWAGPELQPWHRVRLAEFTAADYAAGGIVTLDQYRARERELLDQVRTEVARPGGESAVPTLNRYTHGSLGDPDVWEFNWNQTYVLEPDAEPRGGVLLLHGLTDSPYSLRSIGVALVARGYHVVGLRLPGHGTAPSGLVTFEAEDLEAATKLAMQDLRTKLGPDRPIHMVGYSNGAAFAVSYALDARADPQLPRPGRLVLISPAIGITRLAAIGRIRTGISELQGFGRAAWQLIEPEIDPYKYQSFSFNAAGVTQRFTSRLARRIASLSASGPLRDMPPMLAFVSTVDSTVNASAVIDSLLGRLAPAEHELVVFDVNRLSVVQPMLVADAAPLTRRLLAQSQRPYALALITNANASTLQVHERRSAAMSPVAVDRPLELAWPRHVFSLSHVALPFPADDPLYGYAAPATTRHVQLGRVEIRGENGVLNVPTWMLTRQRSNPFHPYLIERIEGFLAAAP